MSEKYFGLFTSLLYKLLLENASAFNTSENIRSKKLPGTPINNSVTYFDSFFESIFSQQLLSAERIDHIICTGRSDLIVI